MNNTAKRWKDKIGIEINLTDEGLHELSLIIADGCPRRISNHGKTTRIACPASHIIDRKTCYDCWRKWLEEHSTIKEEI